MRLSVNYATYDDERLIGLIAQSQEAALAHLYDRYHRLVFSVAFAIVGDHATAEEITLDVFMRVWQKAGSYRADQSRVSTWLTHITRHLAIDILRRRSVRPDQYAVSWDGITPSAALSDGDPQELAELSLRRERILAALAQLPADQKQAVALAYFGGLTQREIAEVLMLPLGTVKTRLRLAIHKLRDLFKDETDVADKSAKAYSAYNMRED